MTAQAALGFQILGNSSPLYSPPARQLPLPPYAHTPSHAQPGPPVHTPLSQRDNQAQVSNWFCVRRCGTEMIQPSTSSSRHKHYSQTAVGALGAFCSPDT
ncbi:hypothetical protein J6590_065948 [Homalodisca vitripennis]|nr:hypothetical protein J6590_065948 [Homalodisca vitripennis]